MKPQRRSMLLLLILVPALGLALGASRAEASSWGGMAAPCGAPFLVSDVYGGGTSSGPTELVDLGGVLLFAADSSGAGQELWRSDGTQAGTRLVRDILTGPMSSSPRELTVMGGVLYFVVSGASSGVELWRSDGTMERTERIKSFPSQTAFGLALTVVGNRLFFSADDGVSGEELWQSDGTPEGTVMVRNIAPGSSGSFPGFLTAVGDQLFFRANDRVNGTELWRSDGTPEGTVMVKNIAPGSGFSEPSELTAVGDRLFFLASTGGDANLWTSDGTEAGTRLVKDIYGTQAHPRLRELTAVGPTLFFIAPRAGAGEELWRSDGTEVGTRLVTSINPGQVQALTAVEDVLFFTASDGGSGRELWVSSGTAAGTRMVREFSPGTASTSFSLLAPGPGVLLFVVERGADYTLWQSDGRADETFPVADFTSTTGTPPTGEIVRSGGNLFFAATRAEVGDELFALPLVATDCTAPSLVCTGDQTVEALSSAGASVAYLPPRVADNSLATPQVSYLPPPGSILPLDATLVTATATDSAGNTQQCSFRVLVQDTTAPSIVCPREVRWEATSAQGTVATYPVVVSDAVTQRESLEVRAEPTPGSAFPLGQTLVRISARDAAGNPSECFFPLIVEDTVPPRLTCPRDVTELATGAEGRVVSFEARMEDATSPPPQYSHPPGSAFPVGQTDVTVTATDVSGNTAQCSFRVTVRDPVGPTILCPEGQTVRTSAEGGVVVDLAEPTAEDDLAPPAVSYSPAEGSVFPLGDTVVTATATDLGGNTASCTFTVTVVREEEAAGGCGCGAGSVSGSVAWLLLALFPVWARRRAGRLGG